MPEYRIVRTQPWTYLDRSGQPVNGFRLTVEFPEFDEVHMLDVPRLDPDAVERAAQQMLDNRRRLAELGG